MRSPSRLLAPLPCLVLLASAAWAASPSQTFDSPWRSFQTSGAPQGNYGTNLTAADLNGDGLADAIVAQNVVTPGVRVFLNLGKDGKPTTFDSGTFYPVARGVWQVVAADFDGDGDRDLVATDTDDNYIGTSLVLFRNQGGGTFLPAGSIAAGGPTPGLVAADLDRDGDVDLAAVHHDYSTVGTISVLLNRGNATFLAPVTYASAASPDRIEAGDLDGDLDPDLVVGHGGGRVSLFLNNGTGVLSSPVVFESPDVGNADVVILDPDGDGDLDFVSAGFYDQIANDGRLLLRRNDGAGHFATELVPYELPYRNPAMDVTGADLDGDGRDEVLGAQPFEKGFVVFRDDNALGFQAGHMYAAATFMGSEAYGTIATAAGDLDGDGDPDVVTTTRVRRLLTAHENLGDGTFPERPIYGRGAHHTVLDVGDVDKDGDLDVATSHGGAYMSNVVVHLNDGRGAFTQSYQTPQSIYGFAKLRDLDGDGKLDLLFTTAPGPPSGVPFDFFTARGDGHGGFGAVTRWPLNACGLAHPGAFDVDGDGDLDVVNTEYLSCPSVTGSGQRLFISLNRGDGTFLPPTTARAGIFPFNVTGGDFDGDGKLDLATCSANASAILLGRGDGTFLPERPLPSGNLGANIVALDLNADGDLDLATLESNGHDESVLAVLLGDGAGAFTGTVYSAYPTQDFREWVAAGDADRDGDPDLMAGGIDDALLFVNDGTGALQFSGRFGIGLGAHSLHFADVTGDGTGDLLALVTLPSPPAGSDFGVVAVAGTGSAITGAGGNPVARGGIELSSIAPSPLGGKGTVALVLDRRQDVTISVFDVRGRRVAMLFEGTLETGPHRFPIDASGFVAGLYLVHARGENAAAVARLVVVR